MLFRVFSYVWLALTLYVLLKPGLGFEEVVFFRHEDKVAHFGLFLNLTLLWYREFAINLGIEHRKSLLAVVVFGVIIAGFTEVLQKYIPNRGMDAIDFIFNLLGVFSGVFFYLILEKTKQYLVK